MNNLSSDGFFNYYPISNWQYYPISRDFTKRNTKKNYLIQEQIFIRRSKCTNLLIGILFSLIISSAITFGITSTYAFLTDGKTYTNDIYEFQIQYPDNPEFEIEEIDYDETDRVTDIVTFYSIMEDHKDLVADNFGVSVDKVDYDVSLHKYLDETIEVYGEIYEDFELIEQNTASTLGGLPAYELVYSYTDKEIRSQGRSHDNEILRNRTYLRR